MPNFINPDLFIRAAEFLGNPNISNYVISAAALFTGILAIRSEQRGIKEAINLNPKDIRNITSDAIIKSLFVGTSIVLLSSAVGFLSLNANKIGLSIDQNLSPILLRLTTFSVVQGLIIFFGNHFFNSSPKYEAMILNQKNLPRD